MKDTSLMKKEEWQINRSPAPLLSDQIKTTFCTSILAEIMQSGNIKHCYGCRVIGIVVQLVGCGNGHDHFGKQFASIL